MASDIGFIGLGNMGYRMAVNLLRHNGKIEIARSSKEVASKCQTLLTIVPTSENVRQVFLDPENGVIAAPEDPNRLMLECSTIDIKATRDVGKQIMEAGMGTYVDAPVSGGARGAEEATIAFLVGHPGPPDTDPVARRITDVVAYMGLPERVNFCGSLGGGLVGKIVNNYISVNNVLSLAEGMAFGLRYGVDRMTLYNCVKASSGNSWVLENKNSVPGVIGRSPASNNFRATFPARMVLKDLGLGIEAAREVGIEASMGQAAFKSFEKADNDPRTTDLDCTSVWLHMNDEVDDWAENQGA